MLLKIKTAVSAAVFIIKKSVLFKIRIFSLVHLA